jgi:hypothetical protein
MRDDPHPIQNLDISTQPPSFSILIILMIYLRPFPYPSLIVRDIVVVSEMQA